MELPSSPDERAPERTRQRRRWRVLLSPDPIGALARLIRRRIVRGIKTEARRRTALFQHLGTLDELRKQSLLVQVRRREVRVVAGQYKLRIVQQALFYPLLFATIMGPIVGPAAFLVNTYQIEGSTASHLGVGVLAAQAGSLFAIVALLVFATLFTPRTAITAGPLLAIGSAAWFGFLLRRGHGMFNLAQYGLASGLLAVSAFYLGLLVVVAVEAIVPSLILAGLRRRHPEAFIVDGLLMALSRIENSPHKWPDRGLKELVLDDLESTAVTLERGLPEGLSTKDPRTDAWLAQCGKEMAAGIRQLKKTVLLPSSQGRTETMSRLSAALCCAIAGHLDALERADPEPIVGTKLRRRILASLVSLFWAGLPGLAFIGLQNTQYALKGSLAESVAIGVIAWGVLRLVVSSDKSFTSTLQAAKDIRDALPLPGKK